MVGEQFIPSPDVWGRIVLGQRDPDPDVPRSRALPIQMCMRVQKELALPWSGHMVGGGRCGRAFWPWIWGGGGGATWLYMDVGDGGGSLVPAVWAMALGEAGFHCVELPPLPVTKFSSLCGSLWTGCHGSVGWIWPMDQKLSTPAINQLFVFTISKYLSAELATQFWCLIIIGYLFNTPFQIASLLTYFKVGSGDLGAVLLVIATLEWSEWLVFYLLYWQKLKAALYESAVKILSGSTIFTLGVPLMVLHWW